MIDFVKSFKKIKQKLNESLTKDLFLDDSLKTIPSSILNNINERLELYSLSEWFPYQFYDKTQEIFYCEGAKGILIEATPMVGASEDNAEALYSFIQRVLPEGTIAQFLLFASPYLGKEFRNYLSERKNHNAVLEKNAVSRIEYLKKGIHKSLIPDQQAVLRDFRLLITLVFDDALNVNDSEVLTYRNHLQGTLKAMGLTTKVLHSEDFMQWIDMLVRPSDNLEKPEYRLNDCETLSSQLASSTDNYRVTSQKILVNDNGFEIRNFRVKEFPRDPVYLYEMDDLIGNLFDNNSRIGCPFSFSLIMKICNQSREGNIVRARAPRAAQRAMVIGKLSPTAVEEANAARSIVKQLEDNERLVAVEFQATLFYKAGTGDEHEAALMNVFQTSHKKWHLVKNNYLQLVTLIAHLPLAQNHALFEELKKLGLTQKIWALNVANMVPILAEMKGMRSSRLMLTGRRGQILSWDPFANQRGSYNSCVAGISGSGKSVTVQEIAASLITTGARVWIIDVGRSYKKLCNLLDGQFVEFTKETPLCLNPFSTVNNEEFDEFYAFTVPLIAMMADPKQGSTTIQTALIEQAVKEVWREKGRAGGIGDIAKWLLEHSDERARDLGTALYSYTPEGQYGSYFNGTANVNFNKSLVVFELEEINGNKRLQTVLFMLLMYHVTEKMYLGGRTTQMALIIDEAWDMLKGGHGGDIIESIARRARKYKGSLITITQSISDYFASPAAEAAYNNSYWKILHAQNKANISALIENKKITMSPFQERLLRSVTTEHGMYSELMIMGDSGEYAVGRLLLDPYSRILYSTQAADYAAVNSLCEQGVPLMDAIGIVAEKVFGNRGD